MARERRKLDATKAAKSARKSTEVANKTATEIEIEVVRFQTGDRSIDFNIDITAETVWASQQQIADLFDRDRRTITEHIRNIFAEGELEENSVSRKFRQTASDGKAYMVTHYDLDMILSVGYRVSSPKATKFRQWATRILRAYLTQGYALNEARLRGDPQSLLALAEKLRALREEEKSYFHVVQNCFKESACDYDPKSQITRTFFARLQNTFHFAITEKTAAEIILERAWYKSPNMGLTAAEPTMTNAKVAKNYLDGRELRRLRILSEQFTLFVEERAARGEETTMQQLLDQFNRLLEAGDYPILPDKPDRRSKAAQKHAQAQYAMWSTRQNRKPKLEAILPGSSNAIN